MKAITAPKALLHVPLKRSGMKAIAHLYLPPEDKQLSHPVPDTTLVQETLEICLSHTSSACTLLSILDFLDSFCEIEY